MSKGTAFRSHDQRKMFDLMTALSASLDLRAVLEDVYRLLLPLVGADYGALAVGRSDRPEELEWIVQDLPPAFLGSYAEMAPHDFVFGSVRARLNTVLRDCDMIERPDLERNMMYHRAREVGSPLEQVMAVMLHAGNGFQSGLSLYRDRRRPFTKREQAILQQLTPALGQAVRNCQTTASLACKSAVLDALLGSDERAIIAVRPPAREIERTAKATALLDAWFPPGERGDGRLPKLLEEGLAEVQSASTRGPVEPWIRTRKRGDGAELEIEIRQVPEPGGSPFWVILLDAGPRTPRLPDAMLARLTPAEQKVVAGLLEGWPERVIAAELGCKLSTVKTHARSAYDKLGVDGRSKLQSLATRRR